MREIIKKGRYKNVYGAVDTDAGTFTKHVLTSKHLVRINDSWAFDREMFREQIEPNNLKMVIYDDEARKVYQVWAAHFRKNCTYYTLGNAGPQVFLARRHWLVSNYGEPMPDLGPYIAPPSEEKIKTPAESPQAKLF